MQNMQRNSTQVIVPKVKSGSINTGFTRHLIAVACVASTSIALFAPITQVYADESTTVVATPLDHVVAIIDDSVLLSSEVDTAMAQARHQISAQGQTPPSDDVLRPDVIRQLILRKIQLGIIARNGASVDDAALNTALTNIAQQQGFDSLSAFQAKLDSIKPNGYADARKQILDDLNIKELQQQRVGSRIKITNQDIDNFLNSPQGAAALKPEFHFTVIQVPVTDSSNTAEVSAALKTANDVLAELKAGHSIEPLVAKYGLKGGDQGWHSSDELPTPFVDALSKIKKGEYTQPLVSSQGVDFLRLNDERSAASASIHQYHVRHILVKTSAVVSPEQAKLKITDIEAKLKAGASFETLAKTYSDDPGSAQSGGDLSWVAQGEMVPAFEDVMIHTPVGQVSAPFQTQFGWHILEVEGERDQDMTALYRRNAAKEALYERQYPIELDNWLREIRAEAYVDMREGKQ